MMLKITDDYLFKNLLPLNCRSIEMTYPNGIRLDFGEKIEYYTNKFGKRYRGEWCVYSEYCAWRIRKGDKILCSSYLDSCENHDSVKNIEPKKPVNISRNKNDDFTFVFDSNYTVDFLCFTKNEDVITVANKNTCYAYNRENKWRVDNNNAGLTELEKTVNEHSVECDKRWKEIIPRGNGRLFCKNCFYYLSVSGDFYSCRRGLIPRPLGRLKSIKPLSAITSGEQHTPPFRAGLLIFMITGYAPIKIHPAMER